MNIFISPLIATPLAIYAVITITLKLYICFSSYNERNNIMSGRVDVIDANGPFPKETIEYKIVEFLKKYF